MAGATGAPAAGVTDIGVGTSALLADLLKSIAAWHSPSLPAVKSSVVFVFISSFSISTKIDFFFSSYLRLRLKPAANNFNLKLSPPVSPKLATNNFDAKLPQPA